MKILVRALLTVSVSAGLAVCDAGAQGSLTPPDAPGATMKTLDQIEPGTPITSLPYVISAPGVYYLSGNLAGSASGGITISADNVVLDLRGFTLTGDTLSAGIMVGAYRNIEIRNGTVASFDVGVNLQSATFSRVLNLSVVNNANDGVQLGDDCLAQNVRVSGSAYNGINAGRRARLTDCVAKENGTGGLSTGYEALVTGCQVERNQGIGIGVMNDSLVQNCTALNNGMDGSSANIAAASNCRILGNQVKYGPVGLVLSGSGGVAADNYVKGCADNYVFAEGNQLNLLLCEIPESLDWPCSAKFAGSLTCILAETNGITVNADNVTIDMAGHTLVGPGANSGCGVYQNQPYRNLRVSNGTAVNWLGSGKLGFRATGYSSSLSDLQASTNNGGIHTGAGSLLRNCKARECRNTGIYAASGCTFQNCEASYNGAGFYALAGSTLDNCSASYNRTIGLYAENDCSINNCVACNNDTYGISTTHGCTIQNCTVGGNMNCGLMTGNGCTILHCTARDNRKCGFSIMSGSLVSGCTGAQMYSDNEAVGILVSEVGNRLEGNNVTQNACGIRVNGTGNIIIRNTARSNALNWDVAAGNVCLVVQAATAGAFTGDSGGTAPGSTDPNANFTY